MADVFFELKVLEICCVNIVPNSKRIDCTREFDAGEVKTQAPIF